MPLSAVLWAVVRRSSAQYTASSGGAQIECAPPIDTPKTYVRAAQAPTAAARCSGSPFNCRFVASVSNCGICV